MRIFVPMAIISYSLLCVLLFIILWAILGIIAAWRRRVYTYADWQKTSVRICRAMRHLCSASSPASGWGCDRRFHRQACHLLLQGLLANTVFIINFVNDGYWNQSSCPREVLSQAVRLLVRLHYVRLQLLFWPPAASVSRIHALAAAEGYVRLCVALTASLNCNRVTSLG
jgi:hypothetical protein